MKKLKKIIVGLLAMLLIFDPTMMRQVAYAFELIETTSETVQLGDENAPDLADETFQLDIEEVLDESSNDENFYYAPDESDLIHTDGDLDDVEYEDTFIDDNHLQNEDDESDLYDEEVCEDEEDCDFASDEEICLDAYGYEIKCPEICEDEYGYEVACLNVCLDYDGEEISFDLSQVNLIDLDEVGDEFDFDTLEPGDVVISLNGEGEEICSIVEEVEVGHVGSGFGVVGGEGNIGDGFLVHNPQVLTNAIMPFNAGPSTGWVYSGDISINRANFLNFFHLNGFAAGTTASGSGGLGGGDGLPGHGQYNSATGSVRFTDEQGNRSGSATLAPRIDMGQDFAFTGNIFLGRATQQGWIVLPDGTIQFRTPAQATAMGRSNNLGADGIAFAFHPNETRRLGTVGNGRGIGGVPNAFGFVFDTWYNNAGNTSTIIGSSGMYTGDPIRFGGPTRDASHLASTQFAGAQGSVPGHITGAGATGSSGQGIPFGGFFMAHTNSTPQWMIGTYMGHGGTGNAMAQPLGNSTPGRNAGTAGTNNTTGTANTAGGHTTHRPGTLNPTNNAWHHVSMSYDAASGIMTVSYVHSSALSPMVNDEFGNAQPGYVPCDSPEAASPCGNLAALHPGARQTWSKDVRGILQSQTLNDHEADEVISYAFSIGSATGGSVNEQGFRILTMSYAAHTSLITARYFIDDSYEGILAPVHVGLDAGGIENFYNVPEEWSPELGFSHPTGMTENVQAETEAERWRWRNADIEQGMRDAGWFRSRTEVTGTELNAAGYPVGQLGANVWQYVDIPLENNLGTGDGRHRHRAAARLATTTTIDYFFRRAASQINVNKVDEFGAPLEGVTFELHQRIDGELVPVRLDVHANINTGFAPSSEHIVDEDGYVWRIEAGSNRQLPVLTPSFVTLTTDEAGFATTGTVPAYRYEQLYYGGTRARDGAVGRPAAGTPAGRLTIPASAANVGGAGSFRIVYDLTLANGEVIQRSEDFSLTAAQASALINLPIPTNLPTGVTFGSISRDNISFVVYRIGSGTTSNSQTVLSGNGNDFWRASAGAMQDGSGRLLVPSLGHGVGAAGQGVARPVPMRGERVRTDIATVPVGVYYLVETSTPEPNVLREPIRIDVPFYESETQQIEVNITNFEARGAIEVQKNNVAGNRPSVLTETGLNGAGFVYRVYRLDEQNNRTFVMDIITNADGLATTPTAIPEINISGTATPNRPLGEGQSRTNDERLTLGRYLVREYSAPAPYILDTEWYEIIDLEFADQSVLTVVPDAIEQVNFRFPLIDLELIGEEYELDGEIVIMNPDYVIGLPSLPTAPGAPRGSSDVSWYIYDDYGVLWASGNETGWWFINRNGVRETHESYGGITAAYRDPSTGNMTIPSVVTRGIPNGVYEIVVYERLTQAERDVLATMTEADFPTDVRNHPNFEEVRTGVSRRSTGLVVFVRIPDVAIDIDRPINPESIVSPPTFDESELTWEIRYPGTHAPGEYVNGEYVPGTYTPGPIVVIEIDGEEVVLTGTGPSIPGDILRELPDGNYTVVFYDYDPVSGETARDQDNFYVRRPGIEVDVNRPINPGVMTGTPGLTYNGEPIPVPDEAVTWIISGGPNDQPMFGGNGSEWWLVDVEGNRIPGTGNNNVTRDEAGVVRIPNEILNQLPGGYDYNIRFDVTDPVTTGNANANENFRMEDPVVDVAINNPVNPDSVVGNPSIPGLDDVTFSDADVTWVIREAGQTIEIPNELGEPTLVYIPGRIVDQGPGMTVPQSVLDGLAEGDYRVTFTAVDPEGTGRTGTNDGVFRIQNPEIDIAFSGPVNPDNIPTNPITITGTPSVPGRDDIAFGNDDVNWIIRDESGVPIFGGNGNRWFTVDADGNEIDGPSGTDITRDEDGGVVIPGAVINRLPEGNYNVEFSAIDPETGREVTTDADFIISDPRVDIYIDRDNNPGIVLGTPSIPELPNAEFANEDITWLIREAGTTGDDGQYIPGRPVLGGNGDRWFTVDADGNEVEGPNGIDVSRTPEGGVNIPPSVVNALPEGDYNFEVTATDSATNRQASNNRHFSVIDPIVDIEMARELNPPGLAGVPSVPELPDTVFGDEDVLWMIREAGTINDDGEYVPGRPILAGNGRDWWLTDENGDLLLDTGSFNPENAYEITRDAETGAVNIPPQIINNLPEGEYTVSFYVVDRSTEREGENRRNFIVEAPVITIEMDRPINPPGIDGIPTLPGDDRVIRDEDVTWEIREPGTHAPGEYVNGEYVPGAYIPGDVVASGVGNNISEDIINNLPEGSYRVTFVVTDPETGRHATDAGVFEVVDPVIDIDMDNRNNPNGIVGTPSTPGVPDVDFTPGDVVWTIRDRDGNPVLIDGNPVTGTGNVPAEVVNSLPGGNYNVEFIVTDPETGRTGTSNEDFTVTNPVVDITPTGPRNPETNVVTNPESINAIPSVPGREDVDFGNGDIEWMIRDEEGTVVAGGNGETSWIIRDGQQVPGPAVVRNPETGGIYIPEEIINSLPEGNYNLEVVATDPETGRTGSNDLDFAVADPIINITLNRPINPGSIIGTPSIPGIPDEELTIQDEDIVWTIRDEQGNPILIDGNPVTGVGPVVPGDVLANLPEGNYNVTFVVTDPETGRTGSSDRNFIVRFPNAGLDIEGPRDTFAPGLVPVNPENVVIRPNIPGLEAADIPDDAISWVIRDGDGNVVIEGDGGSWWLVDEEGNEVPATGGEFDRDSSGNVRLPDEVLAQLPDGNYRVEVTVTDPETGVRDRVGQDIILRQPAIDVSVARPINPGSIIGTPSIPGVRDEDISDNSVIWTIRDGQGNPILIDGNPVTGIGRDIPADVINNLPAGDYNVIFVVTDPDTGEIAADDALFTVTDPIIDIVITGPVDSFDPITGYPVNPDAIVGNPSIPGLPNAEFEDEDITWTIRDRYGNTVLDASGNPITGNGREVPADIINRLPEGDYNVNFIVTDPETGRTGESDASFIVRHPEAGIIGNRPINPENIIGTPVIPGVDPGTIGDEHITWEIRDENGDLLAWGDGATYVVIDLETGNELSGQMGPRNTVTGQITIPESVLNQLRSGDYTAHIQVEDVDTGESATDDWDFTVAFPDVEIDRPVNPGEVALVPGTPESDINWTIVNPDGEPVIGGDSENWWLVNPETGERIPETGGAVDRDVETGVVVLPPTVGDELTGGDYRIIIEEVHPDYGVLGRDEDDFIISRPGLDVDRPFNPDEVGITPGHPDTDLEWIITTPDGTPIVGGDRENWWQVDPETGLRIPDTGGELVIDEGGYIVFPPEVIDNLPEGDYNIIVTERHPEHGEITREEDHFVITRPGVGVDRPTNPGEVIIRPGHPDTDTTWIIEDETGNSVAGGDENNWWLIDEEGNRLPNTGGALERDPETGAIMLPPDLINNLPEGDYRLVVIETHPEHGEVARDEQPLDVRNPAIVANRNRPINPGHVYGTPSIPNGEVSWILRDSEGNEVARGEGGMIPEEILNHLPDGTYNASFTVIDPETGRQATDDVDFSVRFPAIEVEIEGGSRNVPGLNPDQIIGRPTLPDSEVTWIIRDTDGNEIARGEGTVIDRDFIMNLPEGIYEVQFREYDPETGEYATDETRLLRCNNAIYGNGTISLDREQNPENVEFIPRNPGGSATWVIRDADGNIVAEGEGLRIPDEVLYQLADGDYVIEWTYRCPISQNPGLAPTREFTRERIIPSPGITAGVDRPVNPESITGTPTNPNDDVTWVIRDSEGNIVAEGVGTSVPRDVIDGLANGNYRAEFTVTCPETGQTATDDVDFAIERPAEEIPAPGITAGVDRPVNPESITGTPTNPNDDVTWVIRDSEGNIVAEGVGTSVPRDVIDGLANGNYRAEFTVTCPETGQTAIDSVDFTINRPVQEEVRQPILPQTGYLGTSLTLFGGTAMLLGMTAVLKKRLTKN